MLAVQQLQLVHLVHFILYQVLQLEKAKSALGRQHRKHIYKLGMEQEIEILRFVTIRISQLQVLGNEHKKTMQEELNDMMAHGILQ